MWLVFVDTLFALLLTLTIPFALCAEVVAKHSAEDKVLFRRKLVQRTGDDEPDGLQTLAPPKIHVQVLLSGWLQQVWDTLTLQSLYRKFTVLLVAGKQHHMAHTFIQFVDVVHQYFERCGYPCCRSHYYYFLISGDKDSANRMQRVRSMLRCSLSSHRGLNSRCKGTANK